MDIDGRMLCGNLDKPGRARSVGPRGLKRMQRIGHACMWWGLLWQPRDVWVGVYWKPRSGTGWGRAVDVYVCVLPCLPIKLMLRMMLPVRWR